MMKKEQTTKLAAKETLFVGNLDFFFLVIGKNENIPLLFRLLEEGKKFGFLPRAQLLAADAFFSEAIFGLLRKMIEVITPLIIKMPKERKKERKRKKERERKKERKIFLYVFFSNCPPVTLQLGFDG